MKKRLFILGSSGFVSSRLRELCVQLAKQQQEQGEDVEFESVSGCSPELLERDDPSRFFRLARGASPLAVPEIRAQLLEATHVLCTVPPSATAGVDPFLDTALKKEAWAELANRGTVRWMGYVSTTGVYGERASDARSDADDEDAFELKARLDRGRARIESEKAWLGTGLPVHVFRLPGIYGPPDRGPLAKIASAKHIIVKPGHFFNRIHVDDVCHALLASMKRPNPGRAYNVTDDEPASSDEVNVFACELLGLPVPPRVPFDDPRVTPASRSFYEGDSRVWSNKRMKRELGLVLEYPTYREGMRAHLRAGVTSGAKRVPSAKQQPEGSPPPVSVAAVSLPERIKQWWVWALLALQGYAKRLLLWFRVQWLRRRLTVLLVDNGSLRPSSTLGLRRLASKFSDRYGFNFVLAASYRFSNRIDPASMNGVPAVVVSDAASVLEAVGGEAGRTRPLLVVPMFVGPSNVGVVEVPNALRKIFPEVSVASHLAAEPSEPVCLLTTMLSACASRELERLRREDESARETVVILIDHGTPSIQVNRVRLGLAARMRRALKGVRVLDCSMERRPGAEYDFNEPMLENVFDRLDDETRCVLVPAFLFAGNHAGPDGDIETILKQVRAKRPSLRISPLGNLLGDETNDDVMLRLVRERVLSRM